MTTSIQLPPPKTTKTTPLRELIASVLSRANKEGIIYVGDERICPGIHFCPGWDYLAIFDDSPEAAACTCPPEKTR